MKQVLLITALLFYSATTIADEEQKGNSGAKAYCNEQAKMKEITDILELEDFLEECIKNQNSGGSNN